MNALLRAELIKLSTTRTFAALAGATVVTSLLLAGLTSLLTEPTQESVLVDVFVSDTSSLFIMVLAVVGMAGEWRHRTITGALLAAPDRPRFLAAKTLAFAAAGVALSLLATTAITILGLAILSARDLPTPELNELLVLMLSSAVVSALHGALGVALGALLRNQVVALVGILLAALLVEPALISTVPEVARYGPLVALPMAADFSGAETGFEELNLLSPGLAILALMAWIGALSSMAAALLVRRDVE